MKNEHCDYPYLPKLLTPREISQKIKRPLHEVLSVIFIYNIVPTALADDIPVFSQKQGQQIVDSLNEHTKKVKELKKSKRKKPVEVASTGQGESDAKQ